MIVIRTAAIALFATTAALSATAPASASPSDVTMVRYGDLKLDTDQGKRVLTRRVGNAVERVCGVGLSSIDPNVQACRQEARNRAMSDLNRAGIAL